jgi:hypothetical protein
MMRGSKPAPGKVERWPICSGVVWAGRFDHSEDFADAVL